MTSAEATETDARMPHTGMSVAEYVGTRISSLKPPLTKAPNPLRLLRMLSARQWAFFTVAFAAWTWDAFDFFTVSLSMNSLTKTFHKSKTDITWGITLVLMFRSVGSIVFGIAADRYGRKWPFVVNVLMFTCLEIGTSFAQTYQQFLACRALFGVAMGGLYGNAAATALEDCPDEARGLMSGILQQGYAFGYLLCAAFSRALVDTTSHAWRPIYWFAAGPPVIIASCRLLLPETEIYKERERLRKAAKELDTTTNASKAFMQQGKVALKKHWLILSYMVLLMAGFNFMSHGSQDLYPTMLSNQYEFDADMVTVTQVVANLGAMSGGVTVGFLSQVFGRRLSIAVCCIGGGALLYPYSFTSSYAVMAAAFFEQFFVQGAWGVVPIHLMELSPPAFTTFVVGTSYQLGNLASSASSTIESRIGEQFPLPDGANGVKRYKYGHVICIFMGCVFSYLLILTLIGPENLGKKFGVANDQDAKDALGENAINDALGLKNPHSIDDMETASGHEKETPITRHHS